MTSSDTGVGSFQKPATAALEVAHRPELVPAGAEQRYHLTPLGHSFSGVVPMFQGIPVTRLTADPISAAVKPTAGPPHHSWRLARHPAPVPGTASRAQMHGEAAVHGFVPP